ncbi:c-type cytochrome [Sulfitobacter sp. JB4-11]|uniref:c-type cytochrome n=1 Tax=Sulfitobacter rhodophyticola TaxID=3238304 RepID=UPI00351263CC
MLKKLSIGLLTLALAAPALADGDADKGEKVFRKCKACHAVGENAKNKVGPTLNGIIGAAAGANADFKYSDALTAMAADGLIWDEESMTAYLTKPKEFMEGTKMSFAGLRKEDDIENVIAYLATFN